MSHVGTVQKKEPRPVVLHSHLMTEGQETIVEYLDDNHGARTMRVRDKKY